MKKLKIILKRSFLLSLVLVGISVVACDKSKWRAKDHSTPPNWRYDFSLPDSIGGEPPFS
ncbi:MAG: hypothetical protein JRL30_17315 [Deltaproteobacteria bacterium]|jgi:hypothetical protein|nr:hypothetical protein [Deltaproteobacteria bacterium]